jgi:hypothetical protein
MVRNKLTLLLGLIPVLLCVFPSCSPREVGYGLDLSADFANSPETGNSSYTTEELLGMNFLLWMDEFLDCGGDDQGIPAAKPDPFKGWLMEENFGVVQKGFKVNNFHTRATYLEVPVTAKYQFPLGPGAIQAGLGPYVAYGIGGKSGGVSTFEDGTNDGGIKRFDFGLSLRAGYALDQSFRASLGYDYGLVGIAYPGQDYQAHNRCFSIDVGFEFGHLFRKNK